MKEAKKFLKQSTLLCLLTISLSRICLDRCISDQGRGSLQYILDMLRWILALSRAAAGGGSSCTEYPGCRPAQGTLFLQ
jgi:hypothetical protein